MANGAIRVQLDRDVIEVGNLQDLENWIRADLNSWAALGNKLGPFNTGPAREALQKQLEFLNRLLEQIHRARSAQPHNATELAIVLQTLSQLKESEPNRFLSHKVADDSAILQIVDFDASAAAGGILVRRGQKGVLLESPVPDGLRDAQFRFQLYLNEIRSKQDKLRIDGELADVKKRYVIDEAMRDLAGRWKERQDEAQKAASFWLLIFAAAIAGAITLLLYFAYQGWSLISDQVPRLGLDNPNAGKIDWSLFEPTKLLLAVGPFVVAGAVPLIWLFKHLSRLFVDNLGDSRDAALRYTMAQTYVALNNNPSIKPKDDERALILGALFRPGANQPADDGAPIPLFELLKPNK